MGVVIEKCCDGKQQSGYEDYRAPQRPAGRNSRVMATTTHKSSYKYSDCPSDSFRNVQESKFAHRLSTEDINSIYKIGREIGSGKYGIVRMAAKRSYEKKRFAIKSIPRSRISKHLEILEQELEILLQVDHPNVINFYEIYMDEHYFHFVTELCEGGELYEALDEKERFTEEEAAKVIKQVLMAIKHLHGKKICHRDLKPENIMLETTGKDMNVKVIDFGLATFFEQDP